MTTERVYTPKDIASVLGITAKSVRTALRAVYRSGGKVGCDHAHAKAWTWASEKSFRSAVVAVAEYHRLSLDDADAAE